MARSSSKSMARVLERLELEHPLLVTSAQLATILREEGIATSVHVFASRMRDEGWLLPTGQRGVWEFVPAAVAGPYSSMDPLLSFKAFVATHSDVAPALTLHAAAWALGFSDRAPTTVDMAVPKSLNGITLPDGLAAHAFAPALSTAAARGVEVLKPASVLVHMATSPGAVRSWQSASEWLPELAYEIDAKGILMELSGRRASVWSRAGYLVQGMRPDVALAILGQFEPRAKVRFGRRAKSLRNDERWKVADTMLPFDPRDLEAVR